MSTISIQNLSFQYENQENKLFDHINLNLSTTWKIGVVGRNGKGKSTFLKILSKQLAYQGTVNYEGIILRFPYEFSNHNRYGYEIIQDEFYMSEDWQILKELAFFDKEDLYGKRYQEMSEGEKTLFILACLFSIDHHFLVLDEPTNHLDYKTKEKIIAYLKRKTGFMLVSHESYFLDAVVNHILAFEKTQIVLEEGNFSSYYQNYQKRINFLQKQNEKLQKDIHKLTESSLQKERWSNQVEASKKGAADKGYVGHKAAKMMKRSKVLEKRVHKAIDEKKNLLKDVEEIEQLSIIPLHYHHQNILVFHNYSWGYHHQLYKNLNVIIQKNHKYYIKGANGVGKSTLLKSIFDEKLRLNGDIYLKEDVVISYLPQTFHQTHQTIYEFIDEFECDKSLFLCMLRKLGFEREIFHYPLSSLSYGQVKQVYIALCFVKKAHLYILDEPFNGLDIYSRMMLMDILKKTDATFIIVEHDQSIEKSLDMEIIELS